MKKAVTITSDEVLDELLRLKEQQKRGDPGWTVQEIAEKIGKREKIVRDLIRMAISRGMMTAGRRPIITISGCTYPIPVYSFKKLK